MYVARQAPQVEPPVVLGPSYGDHATGAQLVSVQLLDGCPGGALAGVDAEGVAATAADPVVVQHEAKLVDLPRPLEEGDQLILQTVPGDPADVDLAAPLACFTGAEGHPRVPHPPPATGGLLEEVGVLQEEQAGDQGLAGESAPGLGGGTGGEHGLRVDREGRGAV